MGQDSWNLMYGKRNGSVTRKGTRVDLHADEGYGGEKMIPGYAGAYKNSKSRVIGDKVLENPIKMKELTKMKQKPLPKYRSAAESFLKKQPTPKKRK